MRAVVLVGGFGTRLRPLTLTRPKQMLPVLDRTMLEWVMAGLANHGVSDVVLSLGYQPDAFAAAFPDGICAGVKMSYAVEPEPLDTAGAIGFAARHAEIDERFLVVNGDILTDIDITAQWNRHEELGAEATIALTPVEDPSRYGVVPLDADDRVIEFVEKPDPGTAPTNWINAGLYVLEPSIIDRIPEGVRVSVERETFPAIVADRALAGFNDDAYWLDAGTPQSYLQAVTDLLDGVRTEAPLPVVPVGQGASVAEDAEVTGSSVGARSQVRAGAEVEGSILFDGVEIGEGARVAGSVVGLGATIGAGAVLTDGCVIGDGEHIEAGAELSGERIPDPES